MNFNKAMKRANSYSHSSQNYELKGSLIASKMLGNQKHTNQKLTANQVNALLNRIQKKTGNRLSTTDTKLFRKAFGLNDRWVNVAQKIKKNIGGNRSVLTPLKVAGELKSLGFNTLGAPQVRMLTETLRRSQITFPKGQESLLIDYMSKPGPLIGS